MPFPVVKQMSIVRNSEGTHLLTLDAEQYSFSGTLSLQQLIDLREAIEDILNPERHMQSHLKQLKVFKRQVFTHYRQEINPQVKQEKLKLYLETKQLINDLEQR